MALLTNFVPRLLRVNWNKAGGAQALAQELAACFQSDDPIVITSPLTLGPTDGDPPLTIVTNTLPNGTTPEPISIVQNAAPATPGVPPVPPPPPPPPSASTSVFSAQVGSQVSGVNYNCTLYPGGTAAVVEMKNLSPSATLPSQIWVPVIAVGSVYHGFPNVFYEG